MNHIFSINSLGKLIKQQYLLSRKNITLSLLSLFIAYVLIISFILINNDVFRSSDWLPVFCILNIGVMLPFAAYAFPAFRSKEKTFEYLLLPCSTVEKFSFNFIVRLIAPWIILPIIFYMTSHLASELVSWFNSDIIIEPLAFSSILSADDDKWLPFIITIFVLITLLTQSLFFVGASAFQKRPLFKTLVIIGATMAVVILYFVALIEWLEIYSQTNQPWFVIFENNEGAAKVTLISTLVFVLITTWAYAFFKVKEKQIA